MPPSIAKGMTGRLSLYVATILLAMACASYGLHHGTSPVHVRTPLVFRDDTSATDTCTVCATASGFPRTCKLVRRASVPPPTIVNRAACPDVRDKVIDARDPYARR